MPTMPKSAEGFKFILVTVFMAIRTKDWTIVTQPPTLGQSRMGTGGAEGGERGHRIEAKREMSL